MSFTQRPLGHLLVASLAVAGLARVAAGQPSGVPGGEISFAVQGLGGFVGTLVGGAILLALFPDFTANVVERVRTEPGESLLWGIGVLVLLFVLVFLLAITVIGLVLAIPLIVVASVVGVAGNAAGYVAIFGGVTGDEWVALLVGAVVAGVLAVIPVVGGLLSFVVGSLGTGAILREWRAA